jgi:hypothetical protein
MSAHAWGSASSGEGKGGGRPAKEGEARLTQKWAIVPGSNGGARLRGYLFLNNGIKSSIILSLALASPAF